MQDTLVRILSCDGYIRATAVKTTNLTSKICILQDTDPTATIALGRLISATGLMGSLLKGSQRVALSVEGNGPLKKLQAESDAYGKVRATIKVAQCNLPPVNGNYDVANAVGKAGFLSVVKDLGLKEPYRGTVQLTTSEIAEDLAHYFVTSEQIPTTVALGVTLDKKAGVAACGGFLIQAMPGCSDEQLIKLEEVLNNLPTVSKLLREGCSPLEILQKVMADICFDVQTEHSMEFFCNCNREHVTNMLKGLGNKELRQLADREESTEVVCEYCKNSYNFSHSELEELIA